MNAALVTLDLLHLHLPYLAIQTDIYYKVSYNIDTTLPKPIWLHVGTGDGSADYK